MPRPCRRYWIALFAGFHLNRQPDKSSFCPDLLYPEATGAPLPLPELA